MRTSRVGRKERERKICLLTLFGTNGQTNNWEKRERKKVFILPWGICCKLGMKSYGGTNLISRCRRCCFSYIRSFSQSLFPFYHFISFSAKEKSNTFFHLKNGIFFLKESLAWKVLNCWKNQFWCLNEALIKLTF